MADLVWLSPRQYLDAGLERLGVRASITRTAAGTTIELADRASEEALRQVVEVAAARLGEVRTSDTETLAELLPRAVELLRRASAESSGMAREPDGD